MKPFDKDRKKEAKGGYHGQEKKATEKRKYAMHDCCSHVCTGTSFKGECTEKGIQYQGI